MLELSRACSQLRASRVLAVARRPSRLLKAVPRSLRFCRAASSRPLACSPRSMSKEASHCASGPTTTSAGTSPRRRGSSTRSRTATRLRPCSSTPARHPGRSARGRAAGDRVHPQFASNNYVYLSYTTPGPGAFTSRIARYQSPDGGLTLDRNTEFVILDLAQPYSNHNGGDIQFGPDGFLYIGFGDGGGAEDPAGERTRHRYLARQDAANRCRRGHALRDSAGQPVCGGRRRTGDLRLGPAQSWRFSFDRETGELWTGDVGQYAWEEVDRIRLGGIMVESQGRLALLRRRSLRRRDLARLDRPGRRLPQSR